MSSLLDFLLSPEPVAAPSTTLAAEVLAFKMTDEVGVVAEDPLRLTFGIGVETPEAWTADNVGDGGSEGPNERFFFFTFRAVESPCPGILKMLRSFQ